MKRFYFFASAALALLAASCAKIESAPAIEQKGGNLLTLEVRTTIDDDDTKITLVGWKPAWTGTE